MRAWLKRFRLPNRTVWRHATRMTSSAVFAYLATGMVGLSHGYWAVITCLVVVQSSLGATITVAMARVVGTAVGAMAGGLGAVFSLLVPAIPQSLILLLVLVPLSLLASSRAIFKLAPLTGALVLLLAGTNSLGFAFSRVEEIALGTAIGVLFSLFVLPERATAVLVERAAVSLETLGAFAVVLLSAPASAERERIALKLRSVFAQLQNDMKEVEQERTAHLLRTDPFPEHLSRHLQRLRTDVNMLGRTAAPDDAAPEVENIHAALGERIHALFFTYAAVLRDKASVLPLAKLGELAATETAGTPEGFALLTLQNELRALNETLQQRQAAALAP